MGNKLNKIYTKGTKNMKKLLLGLGSIASVVAPVAAVISCGSDAKTDTPANNNGTGTGNDGTGGTDTGTGGIDLGTSGATQAQLDADLAKIHAQYTSNLDVIDFHNSNKFNITEGNVTEQDLGIQGMFGLLDADADMTLTVKQALDFNTRAVEIEVKFSNKNDSTIEAHKNITINASEVDLTNGGNAQFEKVFKLSNGAFTQLRDGTPFKIDGTRMKDWMGQLMSSNDSASYTWTTADNTALASITTEDEAVNYLVKKLTTDLEKQELYKKAMGVTYAGQGASAWVMDGANRFNGTTPHHVGNFLASTFSRELYLASQAVTRDLKGELAAELTHTNEKDEIHFKGSGRYVGFEDTKLNNYQIKKAFTANNNTVFFLKGSANRTSGSAGATDKIAAYDTGVAASVKDITKVTINADISPEAYQYLQSNHDITGMLVFYNGKASETGDTTISTHKVELMINLQEETGGKVFTTATNFSELSIQV